MLSLATDVPFPASLLTAFSTLPGTALIVEEIAPNQPEMELQDSCCQKCSSYNKYGILQSPKSITTVC